MTTIKLDDDAAAVLRTLESKAAQHHLTLAAYLRALDAGVIPGRGHDPVDELTTEMGEDSESEHRVISIEEFERALDELSEGLPDMPVLPPDFSRADIYADHD